MNFNRIVFVFFYSYVFVCIRMYPYVSRMLVVCYSYVSRIYILERLVKTSEHRRCYNIYVICRLGGPYSEKL